MAGGWIGLLAAAGVIDVWAVKTGHETLCSFARRHPLGTLAASVGFAWHLYGGRRR